MVPFEWFFTTRVQSCILASLVDNSVRPPSQSFGEDAPAHWGKNGKFSLKIEKSEVKIAPIFGFNPLIDTLAYPKIPFFRLNLVWFGLGALLKMWKISKNFTLGIKLL